MNFKVVVHRQAQKEIEKLPTAIQKYAEKAIVRLVENPYPNGYKKLAEYKSDRTKI